MTKKQIMVRNAYMISSSNNNIARAIEQQNKLNKEKFEQEIKSKDRADISLKEYEDMKETIKKLQSENSYLKDVVSFFQIPDYLKVIPESIMFEEYQNPASLQTHYLIKFKAERKY